MKPIAIIFAAIVLQGCAVRSPESTETEKFEDRYADYSYCKAPLIRQSSQRSCGMAALTSMLRYWREDEAINERELVGRYPAETERGYTLLQLREVAQKEGVLAFALTMDRAPMEQLLEHVNKGRPVIAAVLLPKGRYFGPAVPVVESLDRRTVGGLGKKTKAHYVVVMGVSDKRLLLMDPQHGYVDIARNEFASFWKAMGYPALVCSEMPKGVRVGGD